MTEPVWAEVVTIGSELVLGQLVDTNAAYIAQALAGIGIGLAFHTTVGDDRERMIQAFRQALDRCHIVITTGGIGPTEDDLTRETAAELLGTELELQPELLEYIENLFRRVGYKMKDNNRKQAYIPKGSTAIHNPYGTAPAFRAQIDNRTLICLPGVPRETEALIKEQVIPFLKEKYTPQGGLLVNRVLKVVGVGESNVDAQIKDIITTSKNPTIGLQASPGEIKVRLTARAEDEGAARDLLDQAESRLKEVLGPLIFGYEEDTLAGNTARLLEDLDLSLVVADGLTCGLAASELGRRLRKNLLLGGLILSESTPAAELADRLAKDFQSDLVLAVSAAPDQEERMKVMILVRSADGRQKERILSLGGRRRLIMERSTTICLFTLLSFLREEFGGDPTRLPPVEPQKL